MPADLDSTKDVDRAARNSTAVKPNETVPWHAIFIASYAPVQRAGLLSAVVTLRGSSG
jgi:hypothetical protein